MAETTTGGLRLRDASAADRVRNAMTGPGDVHEHATAMLRALMDALVDPETGMSVREAMKMGINALDARCRQYLADVDIDSRRILASLIQREGERDG